MPNDVLIEAFMDAIHEKQEIDEFEELMTGKERPKGLGRCEESLDMIDLMLARERLSALGDLKANRALERLQARYPELWEHVAMSSRCE